MPTISVIMPVYNAADTVAAAVDSILQQSDQDFELILVNDGSTDNTAAVLDGLNDPRIIIRHKDHGGVVSANNAALALASGRFIARMDADDVSYPDRLARQRELLESRPELGLVGCLVEFGGDRDQQAGYAHYVDWTNRQVSHEEIARNRFVELPIPNPTLMYRRTMIERYGSYLHGDFPEDYDLFLRWLDAGVKMAKVRECLFRWNDPPDRLSRKDARYRFAAFYDVKAFYLAKWLAQNNPLHPRIVVWGAGRPARKRAERLTEYGLEITAYIDVDPKKTGSPVHGRPRIYYTNIPGPEEIFVVSYVAKRGARGEITRMLEQAGFVAGVNYIHCA